MSLPDLLARTSLSVQTADNTDGIVSQKHS